MKTLIVGLDAFDPKFFENLHEKNGFQFLSRYVRFDGYARFSVTNPPQSEVSWTSIASGLNPGAHGIFDFVHRDAQTYQPFVSLLPTKRGLGGTQFAPPHNANTIFRQAAQQGFSSTSLWWPATFPARLESPVRTIPGLGTPDIHGQLGIGAVFTTATGLIQENYKTALRPLYSKNSHNFTGFLKGPSKPGRSGDKEITVEFCLELDASRKPQLKTANRVIDLEVGKWKSNYRVFF